LRPAGAAATSLAVTGLTNGTSYQFQVRAVNATGTGAYSALSNTVVPTTGLPAAPTIGTATAGNASATVRWTAPANTGSSAITGYLVRTYREGVLINTKAAAASATSLVLTGLVNGQSHRFAVAAVNATGTGAYSAQSNVVVPTSGTPSAPTIGTATAANASATVRWTAPVSTGSSAITGYLIKTYRAGVFINTKSAAASATSLVLTGLVNGQSHQFTVAAVNAAGTGPYSAQSNVVVPQGVSSAPTIGTATAGVSSATVRWSAPATTGGSAITGYLIKTYRAGVFINTKAAPATARSLLLTGLSKGQPHRFTVAAVNGLGTSAYSAMSNQVVPT
jgi:fibronectin type 3 domain-containing protein